MALSWNSDSTRASVVPDERNLHSIVYGLRTQTSSRKMLEGMKAGRVLVDIARDQEVRRDLATDHAPQSHVRRRRRHSLLRREHARRLRPYRHATAREHHLPVYRVDC